MRRLVDILVDASDGKIPSHEECYWALLMLKSVNHFQKRDLEGIEERYLKFKEDPSDKNLKLLSTTLGMRLAGLGEKAHRTMRTDPLTYLGDSGNPFTEENKAWSDMGDKILSKALKKIDEKKDH
ncbi:hypothetical protein [Dyadobacter sp. CY312]|uniref:hypothetical protein n=1 Tax=Dyadobacter sp. CY312 TaxID=2907303 RepID=UPI001F17E82F|nr:hypothetical protein [Dyadobacter sp. CY312]MCE7039261.1 hypothetical protein [Dyadobacter sp. CY312]